MKSRTLNVNTSPPSNSNLYSNFTSFSSRIKIWIMQYHFSSVCFNLEMFLSTPWPFMTLFLKSRRQFCRISLREKWPCHAGAAGSCHLSLVLCWGGRVLTGRGWCSTEHLQSCRTPTAHRASLWPHWIMTWNKAALKSHLNRDKTWPSLKTQTAE